MKYAKQIKQEQTFNYIKTYIVNHGYAPSMREIAEGMGISISMVHGYMQSLIQSGQLETDVSEKGIPRAYRVRGMRVVFK